ncbi:hypothetical protein, partial [Cupriavidus sp. IK-TO18]|uniref:hypothetical protein n=1 Tax=Cupriavidus sp. IK-TO18 TaxID=2782182 RepID=UPI001C553472
MAVLWGRDPREGILWWLGFYYLGVWVAIGAQGAGAFWPGDMLLAVLASAVAVDDMLSAVEPPAMIERAQSWAWPLLLAS